MKRLSCNIEKQILDGMVQVVFNNLYNDTTAWRLWILKFYFMNVRYITG